MGWFKVLVAVWFFSGLAANAESTAPIRVAYYEFGMLYSEGKGLDKDVADELARRVGVPLSVQVLARARIWKDLESGDLDLATSGIHTPERDKFAWFLPYLATKNLAVVSTKVAAAAQTMAQFEAHKEWTWGMVTSFKHGTLQDKFVERLRSSGRLEDSPDSEVLFRKLKEGRIDGIFSQSPIYKKYIGDLDMAPLVDILDWTPGEKAVVGGMVLSKHRFTEADAARWRAALQSLRDDGTLKAIYSKYVTAAEAARLLDF